MADHAGRAACAAHTAASTSPADDSGTCEITSPRLGSKTSSESVAEMVGLPPMIFLRTGYLVVTATADIRLAQMKCGGVQRLACRGPKNQAGEGYNRVLSRPVSAATVNAMISSVQSRKVG